MKKKIYYHNTDCGGVVYYGEYLKFFEEARTELMREKGIPIEDLMKEDILFVVARQEIDYRFPAHYADILEIQTRLTHTSKVKIEFVYEIKNQNNQIISTGRTVVVCVDKNLKPKTIPESIRNKMSR